MQQPRTARVADQPGRCVGQRFGDLGGRGTEYSGRGSRHDFVRRKAGTDRHWRGSERQE
jgi:hypothetical protein